jgi:endogenous inhibitor of DNA gyrase (YacG/DUF329 family)
MTDAADNVFQLTSRIRRDWLGQRGKERCRHSRFTVDPSSGDVECSDCGKPVSPSHALITLAHHHADLADTLKRAREELAEIKQYAPHLRAAKRVEKIWRGRHLPTCPHCQKGIEAETFGHRSVWRQKKQRGDA